MKKIFIAMLALSTLIVSAQTNTNAVVKAKIRPKAEDGPAEREKFMNAVGELWRQGDFDALEKLSDQLRTKKLKFSEGIWKLDCFYRGIGAIGEGEAGFLAAEKQVKAWEEKYTNSIAAPIVEGRILTDHAWFFRGTGYANSITAEGSAKFTEYLAKAAETLEKSKPRSSVCPTWHFVMLEVGIGQGWDIAKFDQIFEEGVKLAPDYYDLYFQRACSLLSRWYGSKGEWQAFAEAQAEAHGAEIYARVVWAVEGYYDSKKPFADGEISWPKMKVGFEKILKDYPDSNWNLNNYCRFACLAGDRATAKELFDRIGENRHSRCWTQREFNQKKRWATKPE